MTNEYIWICEQYTFRKHGNFVRFVIFVYPKNNAILHLYFASYLSLTLSTRTIFHLDFIKHRNAGFDFLEKTGPWAPASFGVSGDW